MADRQAKILKYIAGNQFGQLIVISIDQAPTLSGKNGHVNNCWKAA